MLIFFHKAQIHSQFYNNGVICNEYMEQKFSKFVFTFEIILMNDIEYFCISKLCVSHYIYFLNEWITFIIISFD